jgi:UDPglucose 6-dehydrogenase
MGESDSRAGDLLSEIYKKTCKNSPAIARMNFINAEITKLAVNTYITTKISYANMLARLCEKLSGADVNVVTDALGLDTRIGPKYLKGAVSYGGPCFPRDNRAMARLASRVGASSGLAEATDVFNRAQIKSIAEMIKSHHADARRIGILGLTYKPDTDVMEESFALLLAHELMAANILVVVFDPCGDAKALLSSQKNIRVAASAAECIAESGTVVVATPWKEFLEIPVQIWSSKEGSRTVVDCWRALPHLEGANGVRYVRLGFGGFAEKVAGVTSSAA